MVSRGACYAFVFAQRINVEPIQFKVSVHVLVKWVSAAKVFEQGIIGGRQYFRSKQSAFFHLAAVECKVYPGWYPA